MKFFRIKRYSKDLKRLGISAAEADALEDEIAARPEAGDVIQGLNGVRKIRFGFGGRGKSGGGRAIYYLMINDDLAFMIMAYAKNEKPDLTPTDRKVVTEIIKELNDD